jgi:hypothetical protein
VKCRLIGPMAAALLLVTGCGGEGGAPAESPTQAAETSTPVDADAYARDMLQSLDETEQQIDATSESASNDYGWGTIATSYEALADHWETVTPPEDLELRHRQLISQARAVADASAEVASLPLSQMGYGAGLDVVRARTDLRTAVVGVG